MTLSISQSPAIPHEDFLLVSGPQVARPISFGVEVINDLGLHVRPANSIVDIAMDHSVTITLERKFTLMPLEDLSESAEITPNDLHNNVCLVLMMAVQKEIF